MQQEIQISCGAFIGSKPRPIYGYKTIKADCIAGLAVARNDTPRARFAWMVYHIASGLKIEMLAANSRAQALENVEFATALGFDWKGDISATVQALRQSPGMMKVLNIIHEKTLDAM